MDEIDDIEPAHHAPFPQGQSRLMQVALDMADHGIPVFPLQSLGSDPSGDGRLRCDCVAGDKCLLPGAHPARGIAGVKNASSNEAQVRRWWHANPNANIAAVTGAASTLFVIRVHKGFGDAFTALQDRLGTLPPTLVLSDVRGARLYVFGYPDAPAVPLRGTEGQLAEGIDTLGEGCWYVAPPSMDVSGEPLGLIVNELAADLPDAWVSELLAVEYARQNVPTAVASRALPRPKPATKRDAFYVTSHRVADAGEGAAQTSRLVEIMSLAGKLSRAGVRARTIVEEVHAANKRNCDPPLDDEKVKSSIERVLERDGRLDELAPHAGDSKAVQKDTSKLYSALAAYIRVKFSGFLFDSSALMLEAVWSETGEELALPVGRDVRDLQAAILRRAGSLASFASRAHPAAKPVDVLRALQDLQREVDEKAADQETGEPVQLVETILFLDMWTKDISPQGMPIQKKVQVIDHPGKYTEYGVARVDKGGRDLLFVHFSTLANGKLRGPQFRTKSANELRKLYEQAPGYLDAEALPRELREGFGKEGTQVRLHALDLGVFFEEIGLQRRVTNVTTVEKNANPPVKTPDLPVTFSSPEPSPGVTSTGDGGDAVVTP